MMVRAVSLGATTVAVVDNPAKCPSGTWYKTIAAPTGSGKIYYECNSGEPWTCEWFGWGCKGVPAVPPAAPATEEQLSNPLAWTPEYSVTATAGQQKLVTDQWLQSTSGVAVVSSGVYEAGQAVQDALPDPDKVVNWILVAVLLLGATAMTVIKLKR